MLKCLRVCACLAVGSAFAAGTGLVANGDFAQPVDSGWTVKARDFDGDHSVTMLDGGGIAVSKQLCGFARLYQDIAVPGVNFAIESNLRLSARVTNPGYHAHASLFISYLDSTSTTLGWIRYLASAGPTGLADSDTARIIRADPPNDWHDVSIDLARELRDNLPGITPASVSAVRVCFEAFGSGTGSC